MWLTLTYNTSALCTLCTMHPVHPLHCDHLLNVPFALFTIQPLHHAPSAPCDQIISTMHPEHCSPCTR